MEALPRPARWYLYGIWACTGLVLFFALRPLPEPFPLILLLVGFCAFVLADIFAVDFYVDDQTGVTMTCVDTLQVFLAASAGPIGVLVPFLGSLGSDTLTKRSWYKGLFNASQRSLTFLVLVAVYTLVSEPGAPPFAEWRGLAALVLMTGIYVVLNPLFVSTIVALASGQPLLKVYAASFGPVQWVDLFTLPLGAVLALIWHYEPWLVPAAIVPLVMAYRSFKTMASLQIESRKSKAFADQAQRLAAKLERLQDTTTAMLASDEPQPLLEVVTARLAALLGAPAAWVILAEEPPRLAAVHGEVNSSGLNLGAAMAALSLQEVRQTPPTQCCASTTPWVAVLHIPMISGGRLLGGFGLALAEPLDLVDDDRRVLLAFAAQTAIAVERTQLFDQLRTKQEELLRTSKLAALGTLAAGIAHEFNNLLTAISGFAQLGLTTDDVAEKDEALDVALRTSKRGQSITSGLLTFARRREARRELCQIRDVVDDTVLLVERQLARANISITREYEPIPETVCDAGQIAQVVMNLVTNARDAMAEAGGGRLILGLRARHGQIELRVSDTGVGIPEDLLPQIFQPFISTKAANGPNSAVTGTGLGLPITRGIIENHQGEIEVHSEVGLGTTIVVRLPVIGFMEDDDAYVAESQREASA